MMIKPNVITSRSNALVTETIKLQKKHHRDETGRFLIDGRKLSYEYIKKCGMPYDIFVSSTCRDMILGELRVIEKERGISLTVTIVSDSVLDKMTVQSSPDGIIMIGERSALPYDSDRLDYDGQERIVILDSLQDPGNVGTVIRTALALGYDRIILGSDCADIYSPKTLRASMGAVFSLRISVVPRLETVISELRTGGRHVYAAELREKSVSLDDINVTADDVFVIGNEGHGISDRVSSACDKSVYIPISEESESLNAAIAATVLMWQQRASFQ